MPDLEVTVFNEKLKLSYEENEKQRLINAVEILNKNWNKFSNLHGKVSNFKIVTLISLELQDSIEDMKMLKKKINQSNINLWSLEKEINLKNTELEKNLETINKFELELDKKNDKLLKTEITIDELHNELLQIKKNLLNKQDE